MAGTVLYSGTDSFGRHVEQARRPDGQWFVRFHGYNGYGVGWTRWSRCDAPEGAENMPSRIDYGFSYLTLIPGARLRLPKN